MPYFRQAGVCAAVVWAIAELAPYAIASDGLPLAIEFIQKRDWKNATQALDQALGQSPENLQALYWKSYVLFQTGDYQQSSTYATRYLERNPANGDARKILGLDYFMQGQPVLAETELRRASEASPSDADVRYYLGRIQFERHNLPAALESFQRTVALDPRSVRGFNHLGQTYEGLARFDDAKAAYTQSIELDRQQSKRSEWPYFNLGVLALKQGQAQEATSWLREALVRRPSWPEAIVQLAVSLGSANQVDEARRLLEELLTADPKNGQAHYQLARLLMKMRLPDEARRHFLLFAESKQP